jgi:hypothetical protein
MAHEIKKSKIKKKLVEVIKSSKIVKNLNRRMPDEVRYEIEDRMLMYKNLNFF